MADGGASFYIALATASASANVSIYSAKQATKSAEAEAGTRANLLNRKKLNERNALRENLKRRVEEKKRRLSSVRVQQAASGFTGSGSQLVVFGDVEDRLDEQINEATNQSLDRIADINSQLSVNQFSLEQAQIAGNRQIAGALLGGATKAASGYHSNYDRTGQDPFSIFS